MDLLGRYGLHPRKALGQNFLVDGSALQTVADAAELSATDTVIEVGPGPGILTARLAGKAGRVIAIELDDAFAALLEQRGIPNVQVVHGDVLKTEPGSLAGGRPYKMVGNLPYSIGAAVLRHFLEATPQPSRMVVTLQREVAGNICAAPGDLGILGISVQVYGAPRIVRVIPPGSFFPPPKVHSAIVAIEVFAEPRVPRDLLPHFFTTVRAGFSAPRKQIRNSLGNGLRITNDEASTILREAGIDATRRPETLSVDEWRRVAEARAARLIIRGPC
jgi:16S rRNA (adenine1518-N6/adenine1519-N6)-dimethyltransferase